MTRTAGEVVDILLSVGWGLVVIHIGCVQEGEGEGEGEGCQRMYTTKGSSGRGTCMHSCMHVHMYDTLVCCLCRRA